jgi:hypothetical protein
MITIIKYSKPGCQPCLTQKIILDQAARLFSFVLEERNIFEISQAALLESGIFGVPHLEIYKDGELVHKKTGITSLEELTKILA